MASAGGDWKDMFAAAQRGDTACVIYHLSQGVEVDYQHPEAMMSALVVAASHGHVPVMQALLAHGADPNLAAELGPLAPLQAAQQGGHTAAVQLLLDHGAQWTAAPHAPWWQRWLPGL